MPFVESTRLSRWLANVAIHAALIVLAYFLAFAVRFDFRVPTVEWHRFLGTFPFLLMVKAIAFGFFHLYEGFWRYVSMRDVLAIFKAGTLGSLVFTTGILVFFGPGFSLSVLLMDWVICLTLVGGPRFGFRALDEWRRKSGRAEKKRALIVGAGDGGETLMREIERNLEVDYEVVGFVDDDPSKRKRRIHGIEVLGAVDQLPHLCRSERAQEILIAIPSANREQKRRIIDWCRASGLPFKTIPPLDELLQGKARIGQLKEVRPEDLLGREAVQLNLDRLRQELKGKRILVTGAAGSIGSELCRQVAIFEPQMLLLFDRAESNLYFLYLELNRLYPSLKVIPVVGDILNRRKVVEVIETYTPDILYHAAAYKHVPLMEDYPLEAVQNNVFGTEIVARAACQAGVKKFVLISTDKAVKAVGIMGMTKRMAECILLCFVGGPTTFVAVRFGNVLGSDGSVLPLFKWQIANGGPVTVTDPEAYRYFMLLSEAAQLVLQAGAMGRGGEVFLLDMGEPVKILDLAENVIRLSGLEPWKEIPIEVIGLRPGERLREELVLDEEKLIASEHERVFLVQNHRFDRESFQRELETVRRLVAERDREGAIARLKAMVVGY